jgi:hypothetical protein
MANVTWTTPAGSLGIINERDLFSTQLEANSADSATLTYSKIAGTLPPGIELTSTGLLQGTPFEVATRSLFEFVVRASDGTTIADRSFSLQIQGADDPRFITQAGQLDLSDSTRVGNKWIVDGSYVEFQVQATDTDTASGQALVYDIVGGKLPPGLSMSTTGLISGTVELTDDQKFGDIGGFDNTYDYDDVPYDPTTRSKSRSENFEFTVRVSDGSSTVEQINSIFVYTADYWRIDNDRITVDQDVIQGFPLLMSLSGNRRPIFETDSSLGSFRHNNNVVIKIDVVDFDSLQGALQYSIISGSLPPGLAIDINTGEISGSLGPQAAVTTDYTFTIRAQRTPYPGINVFSDKQFTMSVIGDIDVGVAFTTATSIGTLIVGIPSLLTVEAETDQTNRVLTYEVTQGSLPTGITLSESGNFVGTPDLTEFTSVDGNLITFDSNTFSFDREFTFTVSVSDQYQSLSTTKEFTIKVSLPYGKEFGNMLAKGLINNTQEDLFYRIAQDITINSETNIFRPEDPSFGIKLKPEMLLIAGLEHQTATALQQQMEQNHTPKKLYFGEVKTAVAKQNGRTIYEVVYVEMKDNLENNLGQPVAAKVDLRQTVTKPLLGPLADATRITADFDVYNVTTNLGLDFSISGSKIRYANPLTADLGTFASIFPNAVANMRATMKNLGQREYVHLPLWMRTSQDTSGVPLGYTKAVVLAYTKPGRSAFVRRKILDKSIDFKTINFEIDRYVTDINLVDTGVITPDGSTTAFTINEIIHEEEIKIRENADVLSYGEQVTADNSLDPVYLSADTVLRSADYEPEFSLSHDGSTKKTTINFTNPPSNTSKIRVERIGDKYLAFRKKLKE